MRILHTIQHGPFCKNTDAFFIPHAKNTIRIIGAPGKNGMLQSAIVTRQFYRLVKDHDVWVIHRYYNEYGPIIKLARKKTKIIIQTWGKDYLVYRDNPEIILPRTHNIVKSHILPSGFTESESHNTKTSTVIIPKTNRKVKVKFKPCFHLADKVFFCAPHEQIHDISSEQHGKTNRFLYDNARKIEEPKAELNSTLRIQIGHNANEFNNHIDVLHLMHKYQEKVHLYLPLSYGGTANYINHIEKIAPKTASIQRTTLPLEQYIQELRSIDTYCSFAIRQTGLANLWTHIFLGHSILIHSDSMQARLLRMAEVQFLTESDLNDGCLSMPIEVRRSNQINGRTFLKRIRSETNELISGITKPIC